MSTSAVSSSSIFQELQAYAQQRAADVQQLGNDLAAGNLANAQQDFTTLQSLGQTGPSADGAVFGNSQRQQDFTAIGSALQADNLSNAQQAFAQLESTYANNASAASASAGTGNSGTSSIFQQLQAYRQQRSADVQQLGQDLTAGNVANALQDYNNLQTLAQSGPTRNGAVFGNGAREQDLNAIGTALQANDLAGAQQAFAALESTFQRHQTSPPIVQSGTTGSSGTNPGSGSGTEIILNLANAPEGEQITIGLTGESNGNEQVSISAINPQNQTSEQIAFNVNPNTNQQIVLNLFGSSSSNSTQSSGLNTTA